MKSAVAVALIVMGTVLILAPIGADYFFQRNVVSVLLSAQSTGAPLKTELSTPYRVVCWPTGSLMIVLGIIGAVAEARTDTYLDAGEEDEEDQKG